MKLKKTATMQCLIFYVRRMEETLYHELTCLDGTRGFQKEETIWKIMNNLADW
jgi:hypothetical protein